MADVAATDVKYIGVSAQDFIQYAKQDLDAFREGTRVDPKLADSYASFVAALQPYALKIDYYVFVFSRYIFIKIVVTF